MGILGKILNKDEQDPKTVTEKTAKVVADKKKEAVPAKETKTATKKTATTTKAEVKKAPVKRVAKRDDENAYRIISFPLVSEKATDLAAIGKYVFIVPSKANKPEICKAITNLYGVKPLKVNIIKRKGKTVKRGRLKGRQKDSKKAIITLDKNEQIEVYEGV